VSCDCGDLLVVAVSGPVYIAPHEVGVGSAGCKDHQFCFRGIGQEAVPCELGEGPL